MVMELLEESVVFERRATWQGGTVRYQLRNLEMGRSPIFGASVHVPPDDREAWIRAQALESGRFWPCNQRVYDYVRANATTSGRYYVLSAENVPGLGKRR